MTLFSLVPRGIWRQVVMFAGAFALLFTLIASAEYAFTRREIEEGVASDLRQTAEEVSRLLNYTGHWSLMG